MPSACGSRHVLSCSRCRRDDLTQSSWEGSRRSGRRSASNQRVSTRLRPVCWPMGWCCSGDNARQPSSRSAHSFATGRSISLRPRRWIGGASASTGLGWAIRRHRRGWTCRRASSGVRARQCTHRHSHTSRIRSSVGTGSWREERDRAPPDPRTRRTSTRSPRGTSRLNSHGRIDVDGVSKRQIEETVKQSVDELDARFEDFVPALADRRSRAHTLCSLLTRRCLGGGLPYDEVGWEDEPSLLR